MSFDAILNCTYADKLLDQCGLLYSSSSTTKNEITRDKRAFLKGAINFVIAGIAATVLASLGLTLLAALTVTVGFGFAAATIAVSIQEDIARAQVRQGFSAVAERARAIVNGALDLSGFRI